MARVLRRALNASLARAWNAWAEMQEVSHRSVFRAAHVWCYVPHAQSCMCPVLRAQGSPCLILTSLVHSWPARDCYAKVTLAYTCQLASSPPPPPLALPWYHHHHRSLWWQERKRLQRFLRRALNASLGRGWERWLSQVSAAPEPALRCPSAKHSTGACRVAGG